MWQYNNHQIYRFVPDEEGVPNYMAGFGHSVAQEQQEEEQAAERQVSEQPEHDFNQQQHATTFIQQLQARELGRDFEDESYQNALYGIKADFSNEYNPMPDFFPEYDTRV
jgi:hypothetical protein